VEWFLLVISAILAGGLLFLVSESFKTPGERTAQAIMRFDKFHAIIMSVEGYRLNDPRRKKYYVTDKPAWELILVDAKYKPSLQERWNVYFFLWPIYKTYVYPFAYTKLKKRGDVAPGDNVIWSDERTGESVVSRTGTSNHVDFQVEYPTITGNLFTNEMAKVLVFTNNTLQTTNPFKMLFRINNWLGVTTETIGGALRGVVGKLSIQQLNQVRSETEDRSGDTPSADFTHTMTWINRGAADKEDGIEEKWGVQLTKSIFKAFTPGDANADELMDSFLEPRIADQKGSAAVITAQREGDAVLALATKKAEAYEKTQAAIVTWKKKYLVDTGLAKADAQGNITALVPDANTRVSAEALKALSKLTGTLVIGENLNTLLNLNRPQTTPTTGEGAAS